MTATDHTTATPSYPPGWLVGQLPVGMRDDDLLVRFTTIFEQLGSTLRAGADGIEHLVDPTVTTPTMLDAIARWLSYDVLDDQLDLDHQRRIVAGIGRSLAWRGTRRGLETLLSAITDGWAQVDDPGAVGDGELDGTVSGVVLVRVASTGHLQRHEFEQLIRDEIPAHLDVRLVIAPRGGTLRTPGTAPR